LGINLKTFFSESGFSIHLLSKGHIVNISVFSGYRVFVTTTLWFDGKVVMDNAQMNDHGCGQIKCYTKIGSRSDLAVGLGLPTSALHRKI
jgi:hypothetical protein